MVVPAILLGGGLAATTHGTKLGLRYAVDASPEPVTNALANFGELTTIAAVAVAIWHHPYITLALALGLLALLILLVHRIVRTLRRLLSGDWSRQARVTTERSRQV